MEAKEMFTGNVLKIGKIFYGLSKCNAGTILIVWSWQNFSGV